jgi:hypothetical protein
MIGHKYGSTVITGAGKEGSYAKLAAGIIAFMFDLEIANAIVGEKILQYQHSLCPAIGIRFIWQGEFNIIIYVSRQFRCISAFQGIDHVIQTHDRQGRRAFADEKEDEEA